MTDRSTIQPAERTMASAQSCDVYGRRRTVAAAAVAEMLGCAERTFRQKARELTEKHGFPARLPGFNAWSTTAVERWIDTNGLTFLPADMKEHVEMSGDVSDLPGSEVRALLKLYESEKA